MIESARRKLNIAFIVNALTTGGAEIHTVQVANALQDAGHDCFLFPLLPSAQVSSGRVKQDIVGGNKLLDFSAQRRLNARLNDNAIDIIVAVNGRPATYAQLARNRNRLTRRPVVTIYHTTQLYGYRQKMQHVLHRPFINQSDALVFVSSNQQDYCERIGLHGRRALTIHNGVDGSRFNPVARTCWRAAKRKELGLTDEDYVIGQSAMFRPEKNHEQSVRVLRALREKGVPAVLLLVGDGPLRSSIQTYAKNLSVSDAVIFAGRQQDVLPYLAAFDVGILTSTAVETFSLAALEFMALGVPGVLSDIGGASEMLIDGATGRLFPAGDDRALLSALNGFTEISMRQAFGVTAAKNVASRFTLNSMIKRYEHLFLELVAND
jgi:glycosyltransferase involved in cell wall biosynthesis